MFVCVSQVLYHKANLGTTLPYLDRTPQTSTRARPPPLFPATPAMHASLGGVVLLAQLTFPEANLARYEARGKSCTVSGPSPARPGRALFRMTLEPLPGSTVYQSRRPLLDQGAPSRRNCPRHPLRRPALITCEFQHHLKRTAATQQPPRFASRGRSCPESRVPLHGGAYRGSSLIRPPRPLRTPQKAYACRNISAIKTLRLESRSVGVSLKVFFPRFS